MPSLITSLLTGLALAAATSAEPLAASKRGSCIALASSWTLTNFSSSSGSGVQSTSFNFTDSLDRQTSCQYIFREATTNGSGPNSFHTCEDPALRFKYKLFSNITLEETVHCAPEDGTQVATADVPLRCEVFNADSHCTSQADDIVLYPTLEFNQ